MSLEKPKFEGGIDEDGHYRCFFCGGIVCHDGCDMAQDIYPEYAEEDTLHYMTCTSCGAEYEIIQRENPDGTYPMYEELVQRKKDLSDNG